MRGRSSCFWFREVLSCHNAVELWERGKFQTSKSPNVCQSFILMFVKLKFMFDRLDMFDRWVPSPFPRLALRKLHLVSFTEVPATNQAEEAKRDAEGDVFFFRFGTSLNRYSMLSCYFILWIYFNRVTISKHSIGITCVMSKLTTCTII